MVYLTILNSQRFMNGIHQIYYETINLNDLKKKSGVY